jgi:mRNA-degrading endonuclease toxin of MazEF toxin-antitoxin module
VKKFLRPVVIIRAFGVHACLVVPLTTSRRTHAMRIDVGTVDGNQAKANISQMKVIDTKRLLEKMGMLEVSTFEALRKAVKDML